MITKNYICVTQLNDYIKKRFENDLFLSSVYVKGEISNFVNHKTGHLYFTLKDDNSIVKCVMFSSNASKLKFTPENGLKVMIHGRVDVFVRDGIFTIYVSSMEPDGVGSLSLAYEQLKEKLSKEGLFSQDYKKRIPKLPRRIGVITSPNGAAVRDIINVSSRRFPFADILIYPSQVQGDLAESELISGVEYLNANDLCDVIIIGRGGGSLEDLWSFNSEKLARVIFDSHIPIISAVGHETDFTICDFVCDLRAPTPSAAAELAVPETKELMVKFDNIIKKIISLLEFNLENYKNKLNSLSSRQCMVHPEYLIDDKLLQLTSLDSALQKTFDLYFSKISSKFVNINDKLLALNPLSIISRGYSAIYKDNSLVKSVDELNIDDTFSFTLTDGVVTGKVIKKEKNNGK